MCFSLPSKIISIKDKKAIVDFNGSRQEIIIELVKDAKVGDYVMVQRGLAISKIEEKEVKELMGLLKVRI